MADSFPLFTVGHSNRALDEFIDLLKQHQVGAVADVRSQPVSGRYPYFNAQPLQNRLAMEDLHYVFLGEELGARRLEEECYEAGHAKYPLIARTPAFQAGLERVRRGLQHYPIALMCAERDPLTCHRSILVCRHLREDCQIIHLLDAETTETHAAAEMRLLQQLKLPPKDLFRTEQQMLDDAYDLQGERIAYRIDAPADGEEGYL